MFYCVSFSWTWSHIIYIYTPWIHYGIIFMAMVLHLLNVMDLQCTWFGGHVLSMGIPSSRKRNSRNLYLFYRYIFKLMIWNFILDIARVPSIEIIMYFGYRLPFWPHTLGDICLSTNWYFHIFYDNISIWHISVQDQSWT